MIPALSKPKPMKLSNRLASLPNNCLWTKHNMERDTSNVVMNFQFQAPVCTFSQVGWLHAGDTPPLAQENMSPTELTPQATSPYKLPG